MGLLYDANNVVVGKAVLWLAPEGTPMIADDIPLWGDYATEDPLWKVAGATNEGFTLSTDVEITDITIEEQSTPVDQTVESQVLQIAAELAEDTVQTMKWSLGGTITTTAAGAGTWGKDVLTLSDQLEYFAAILEMQNFAGFARRVYAPKWAGRGSGETAFRRAAEKRLWPVEFKSLSAPEDIQVVDLTEEPTG